MLGDIAILSTQVASATNVWLNSKVRLSFVDHLIPRISGEYFASRIWDDAVEKSRPINRPMRLFPSFYILVVVLVS